MTTTLAQTGSSARQADWATSWLLWNSDLPEEPLRLTVAELAECLCPDLCNRDHPNE